MSDFTGVFGGNPGITANANRNVANGNLGAVPLLLRNGNLGPPAVCTGAVVASCMAEAPIYPIPTTTTGSISMFDPDLQVPYSDSYTVGYQRALGRRSAVEVRYVGSRNRQQWTTYNMNEANILDNGFLQEFLNAQANLYANIAAGRGLTFRYFGPGTGTVPLPIYLAYFSGVPAAMAGDASRYTSANFASSNFYNSLSRFAPNPFTPAGTGANTSFMGSATMRANGIAAGLPANFFFANPDALGGANVTGYGGYTKYNSVQTSFRRRLTDGLQFDGSYSFGKAFESNRYSFRVPRVLLRNGGGEGDVTHAFKTTFLYDMPFGQGRRFFADAGPMMDRLIGGWQISGTARIQSGQLLDLGNVRVFGMTEDEVASLFRLRRVPADFATAGQSEFYYTWPEEVILETIKAYSRDINGYTQGAPTGKYFAPANGPDCIETISAGYGDCGVRSLIVTGPVFRTMDLSISKDVRLAGSKAIQVRFDLLNAFDAVNLNPVSGIGSTQVSGYAITGATSGRTIQIVTRFNW
jgi:hypothetical protein